MLSLALVTQWALSYLSLFLYFHESKSANGPPAYDSLLFPPNAQTILLLFVISRMVLFSR
jgi:hypothetical protein